MAMNRLTLALAFVGILTPVELLAADAPFPAAVSFAYSVSHPVTPLPASVIERIVNTEGRDSDDADAFDVPHDQRVDVRVGPPRGLSRSSLCNAVASVARANGLPIPFFANLIWQESSFNIRTISSAGALGVAQFMPGTANEYGLINPFEPIHALHTAGRFLRKLHGQFGNLGLEAAAYNAGPGRVNNWIARRGGLPGETRNYVIRVTGRPAEDWTSKEFARSPEAALMPAKAPCIEVAEEVAAQTKVVRVANLMAELAAATKLPSSNPNEDKFDETAWQVASASPAWRAHALSIVRGAIRNIDKQRAREASSKRATKAMAHAWARIAERTMRKAAEEFAKSPVEKTSIGRAPSDKSQNPRRTHVADSR